MSMSVETLKLPNHADLHCHLWTTGFDPEVTVIIVHGLGDHGGRFHDCAKRFLDHGIAVAAVDLPGHGRSSGRRGSVHSFDRSLALVASIRKQIGERFPSSNQFLLGHSMGGNLAVNYALRRQEFDHFDQSPLTGMMLVAPMLMPPQHLDRPNLFAAWATGYMLPWVRLRKPPNVASLTADASIAQQVAADPYQHSVISLYNATQLIAQGRFALDHASEVDTPTLILYGERDELIDRAACRHFAMRAGANVRSIAWPNGLHDLLHDVDAGDVFETLLRWLHGTASNCDRTTQRLTVHSE